MAKYNRQEIIDLSNRLENRANSILTVQPSMSADMKAAALLLRLMLNLSDVETVEMTVGDASWPFAH